MYSTGETGNISVAHGGTGFKRERFDYSRNGCLTYTDDGCTDRFVARLKYAQTSSKGRWITFMIKNFTVEEYFTQAGRLGPLEAMEERGFILSHIRKWMKLDGFLDFTNAGRLRWMYWKRNSDRFAHLDCRHSWLRVDNRLIRRR
jgi:hypothetical protein